MDCGMVTTLSYEGKQELLYTAILVGLKDVLGKKSRIISYISRLWFRNYAYG
jgi:hypothetical protein